MLLVFLCPIHEGDIACSSFTSMLTVYVFLAAEYAYMEEAFNGTVSRTHRSGPNASDPQTMREPHPANRTTEGISGMPAGTSTFRQNLPPCRTAADVTSTSSVPQERFSSPNTLQQPQSINQPNQQQQPGMNGSNKSKDQQQRGEKQCADRGHYAHRLASQVVGQAVSVTGKNGVRVYCSVTDLERTSDSGSRHHWNGASGSGSSSGGNQAAAGIAGSAAAGSSAGAAATAMSREAERVKLLSRDIRELLAEVEQRQIQRSLQVRAPIDVKRSLFPDCLRPLVSRFVTVEMSYDAKELCLTYNGYYRPCSALTAAPGASTQVARIQVVTRAKGGGTYL